METCCLHVVVSTKTLPLIGVSGGAGNSIKLREHKFVENPNGISKTSKVYRKSQDKKSVVGPCRTLVKNPSKDKSRGVKSKSGGAVEVGLECGESDRKNSPSKWVSRTKISNGVVKSTLGKNPSQEKSKAVNAKITRVIKYGLKHGNSTEGNKQTHKSLSKWLSYGGCLPLMLQALDTVKDLDEALKPWEKTLNNKERSIILKEQVDWERALEIFNWFKRKGCYEINVIHYNIMLRILGKAQRWDHVENLWNEMQAKGTAPTNSTYGTLIDVYSKGGLKEEALLWLERMNKQGMQPDEVTMGIVVQTYKKFKEFEKQSSSSSSGLRINQSMVEAKLLILTIPVPNAWYFSALTLTIP